MTVPAMAVTIDIDATPAECNAVITYTTDSNLVRGFGLTLSVDNGANIIAIEALQVTGGEYRIFPGQIYVVDGNVIDYNTPYAAGSVPGSTVAVEMASLYTDDANYAGDPNYGYDGTWGSKPESTETLLLVTVDGDCNLTITVNAAAGGVVLEDPEDPPGTVNLTGASITCGWPYPSCWDGPSHCYGDATNDGQNTTADFGAFRDGFNKFYPNATYKANACGDWNKDGGITTGDFGAFRDNFNQNPLPTDCVTGDTNEIYKP